jgi:Phosphotransferase enzyme family
VRLGADPAAAAALLGGMHRRWVGQAPARWPWLRPIGAAIGLVERLYGEIWPGLARRGDLPAALASFGDSLVGQATGAEYAIAAAGPLTLVHGDAQARKMRTGPDGEVALLDWEDVSAAPGLLDLAWLLTSSTEPARWGEVIAAYGGPASGLSHTLPAVMVQGRLTMSEVPPGSAEALARIGRLGQARRRLK